MVWEEVDCRVTCANRSLTIRLPKRNGEDANDAEAEEGEQDGGKVYFIDGDEFVTDPDEKGDEKVDVDGNLLGGLKFKCHTFVLPQQHSRFRDSLYFFWRNLLTLKLSVTQHEREFLISAGKLGAHLKTRTHKLYGVKVILDGRWVTDNYYRSKCLAEITEKGFKPGDLVGKLPDPPGVSSQSAPSGQQSTTSTSSGIY
ncbi:uncharacterized protein BJ212DRAFT_1400404 [Suillus subaureus]|uniref:Uncharacterized protein n=1 Tax=Suillus subaureus TaxID=48587 RepID=A0A9P7J2W9_9AGAM|nr:uncharacterized protein BJ212DRAFT_1400404 [Suillus subaureus]KAG1800528.1 hypothetical protein BJ212DRAFT_1400404 [Suillus subaureus]